MATGDEEALGDPSDFEEALSLPPLGAVARAKLVNALPGKPDHLVERDYLETKSTLDFTQREGFARVAKFIMAVGNRMPDRLAPQFQGYAVLVVGATGDGILGVKPLEHHDFLNGVNRYLPEDCPAWDVDFHPLMDGNVVVVVVVAPPTWGVPPYVVDRDGPDMKDGQVYVRFSSQTRLATAVELRRLIERGQRAADPIDVVIQPATPVCGADVSTAILDGLVAAHVSAMDQRRLAEEGNFFGGRMSPAVALRFALDGVRETPTEDQVTEWEREMRDTWDQREADWLACAWPGMTFTVENRGKRFLTGVNVEIRIEGSVGTIGKRDPEHEGADLLADLPGFSRSPAAFPSVRSFQPADLRFAQAENHDWGVLVTFKLRELRPLATELSDDDVFVLVCAVDVNELEAEWRLTAEGLHDVIFGSLSIPVAHDVDVSPVINAFASRTPGTMGLDLTD